MKHIILMICLLIAFSCYGEQIKGLNSPGLTVENANKFFSMFWNEEPVPYGVYAIEKGDNVWKIAKKYVNHFYKNEISKLTKIEYRTLIGNVAVDINRRNYDELFCGVNDDVKPLDTMVIRVKDYIKRSGK